MTHFDVHTGHFYAQYWNLEWKLDMAFIEDGAKLASYPDFHTTHTTRTHDIADFAAKHRNAIHGYEPVPQGMKDGWMVGQLLFWIPLEHRKVLCLLQFYTPFTPSIVSIIMNESCGLQHIVYSCINAETQ